MCGGNTKETYLEILYFKQFYKHFVFVEDEEGNRNKRTKNILRFRQWLMWGVGIQRNLFNEKIDIKIQLFGNSEQLKDIKSIQSRIGRLIRCLCT